MNARGAAVQGALALAGLAAAYATWQREPSLEVGESFVLDITRKDLQKIRFEDGTTWVELTPGQDDNGPFVWVRLAGKKGSNVALPSGHPMVQTDVPERLVRGSASATAVWNRFAPLQAIRALGVLDAKLLKDFGLDATKKKIQVGYRGMTRSFSIAPAPPGGTEPYLRADDGGAVYLVAGQILTDLQSAQSNLVERRFHAFLHQEFDKLVITTPARADSKGKTATQPKAREFLFKKLEGRPGGQLFPAATPDKPDETAANWHERIFVLFPADVLGKDEKPGPGTPTPVLRLDYYYRSKRLGFLELARSGDSSSGGTSTNATDPTTGQPIARAATIARSEFTAGWMRLAADAQTLVNEGETLFAP